MAQHVDQRRFVDDGPARNVDEVGGRFHPRELARADQMTRLCIEQTTDDDKVRACKQCVEIDELRAEIANLDRIGVRVRGNQRHVEHARHAQ